MTSTRLWTSWVMLMGGVASVDLANDGRWVETLGGILLAGSWIVATGRRR